ncbi:beta-1,3-galactosyl-O-glycosyl-glycoprotein beta-1,6-N-acetylglucosaminyltransferase [Rhineura floridana]|uniref:beta-1,3-galactosyl-O-glycosyl-glycoprotein beta-1,6-N-acetylglucosaminyltransferase n=1 Tax=Rhineura floridana TaxID=261503 RepID=UPI002AC7F011|nr:beta-1,3-galactosyl-O-glycosyl-glycoprotein beta-1,6-N-acetylglucosaminyltransferase [Rhineura floridana]XP_061483642.1 beta-1,3-galactosyl-O-glycosyl-glycoprotein beta-1,6-N-acetylglucosaminyltransferase [Rhineura floridana]XP_061483651.1 beta-1,3-galactosyl-O-glycosyl-glycoprotein beta-1,6-N-acetylglucosaminyltransferase [Rhineura floridana]XP_061483656.1 beta-1,3-galactosyl-O-glycosyl-glycoprotein beta-1,6-N-acetylglucosaminyltransferase [Rhineura floridana]XP_061483665.1 beta-1,3-galacto
MHGRFQTLFEMLRRKFCHCHILRFKLLLVLIFTVGTLSLIKIHQKTTYSHHRHLELTGEYLNNVNCSKILQGDLEEIQKVKLELLTVSFKKSPKLTANDYMNMTTDCTSFIKRRKYIMEPLSKEEAEFPIAYSIVVYHKINMLDRLLRSIYAPQNYYCIHVDKKSPESFLAAVKGIASCFDNVFIASQLESVVYASWSRVQADLNCMKDLYRRSTSWKYLINLCGMDFPIKTNQEIIEKLKALKGENSLETEKMPSNKEIRWRKHHEVVDGKVKNMGIDKQHPPLNTPIFSGSAYFVVSRRFVEYVLENSKILTFVEWAKDTYSPDEYLWASIQRIPEVPGAVSASDKYDVSDMNALARFVKWHYFEGDVSQGAPYPPCNGVHIRSVCVFGVGDLNWMLRKHHFFANKFDTDIDPFAVQCLEEYLRDKALYQDRH